MESFLKKSKKELEEEDKTQGRRAREKPSGSGNGNSTGAWVIVVSGVWGVQSGGSGDEGGGKPN